MYVHVCIMWIVIGFFFPILCALGTPWANYSAAIFCCHLFESFLFQVHESSFLYGVTTLCIIQCLIAQ